MTKKEAAIVSAYTGYLIGSFSEMHEYLEKVFGQPILTHEFITIGQEKIRDMTKNDFINIKVE